jgi:hypothetical protein
MTAKGTVGQDSSRNKMNTSHNNFSINKMRTAGFKGDSNDAESGK